MPSKIHAPKIAEYDALIKEVFGICHMAQHYMSVQLFTDVGGLLENKQKVAQHTLMHDLVNLSSLTTHLLEIPHQLDLLRDSRLAELPDEKFRNEIIEAMQLVISVYCDGGYYSVGLRRLQSSRALQPHAKTLIATRKVLENLGGPVPRGLHGFDARARRLER